jgi:hypothetical protein
MQNKLRQRHVAIVDPLGFFDQGTDHQPFIWGE